MGKLCVLTILVLFSMEDIRFRSISEKWFWGLAGFVLLILFVPPLWIKPEQHLILLSDLKNFLFMHTGASLFEDFVKNFWDGLLSPTYSAYISEFYLLTHFVNLVSRALIGFFLLYVPYVITKKKGLGEGDLLYFTLVSCLFPISIIWLSYFLAFFLGCFLVLFLIVFIPEKKQRILRSYKIPFIPFLSIGFVFGLFS